MTSIINVLFQGQNKQIFYRNLFEPRRKLLEPLETPQLNTQHAYFIMGRYVAQWFRALVSNARVQGSSPSWGENFFRTFRYETPVFSQGILSGVFSGHSGFLPLFKMVMDAVNSNSKNKSEFLFCFLIACRADPLHHVQVCLCVSVSMCVFG